jgi:ACS family hexuronate transporter-like MFS transporter
MIQSNSMSKGFKGYRWVICFLLFLATTTNYLDRQLLSILSPYLTDMFGWSNQEYSRIVISFTIFYGLFMAIAGRFIDRLGTKKGLFWAFVIWNVASAGHALAPEIGIAINPLVSFFGLTVSTSVIGFMFMRAILGIGEASMFPAAIKATAEWFPKKERSLCTGLFNSGTNIGAIVAPFIVTYVALQFGWRWAFVILGGITLIWLIFWQIYYDSPTRMLKKGKITQEEYDYIHADDETDVAVAQVKEEKVAWYKVLKHPQTWSFAIGKFMTDGIWWFFLFWLPLYLAQAYGLAPQNIAVFVAVVFTMATFGSISGGYFPARLMNKGMSPYKARMLAMFVIALLPLVVLGAQPLGGISVWFPVILIGIGASAHQAWSANLFTTVSDMFPKKAVGSVVGFGGMMGSAGSVLINFSAGKLFDHHAALGQVEVGYGIMFVVCAVAYLVAWVIMKTLVPKYRVITEI